jgi:hypothetical protein
MTEPVGHGAAWPPGAWEHWPDANIELTNASR